MEATVEQIPQTGRVELSIQVSASLNYSAKAAQRIAGRFVADEIGYLLRGSEPTLVAADRLYWRVPIALALPHTGPIGTVGTVDVDVETGQLSVTPEQIAEIERQAEDLAQHHASSTCPAS